MLKEICLLNGTSGREENVRNYIIDKIKGKCEYSVDALGSIIAFKKGRKLPPKKVLIAAHMDEVGFIITDITDDGYLCFAPVGGIDSSVVLGRHVDINGINGIIGAKAVHLLTDEEKKTAPSMGKLVIDIGATDKSQAEKYVNLGDCAYFSCDFCELGNGFIKSKALDDRIGCMLMIELINSNLEYDTYFAFNVQEEVGLRGSGCSAYSIKPDIAIVLEATTAADIDGVTGGDKCCVLGNGPVVSFMDGRTIYDKSIYDLAFKIAKENDIKIQTKTKIAGGNDAGAIQQSAFGCRVAAVSLPCRYIHSGASVVNIGDIEETRRFLPLLISELYD